MQACMFCQLYKMTAKENLKSQNTNEIFSTSLTIKKLKSNGNKVITAWLSNVQLISGQWNFLLT